MQACFVCNASSLRVGQGFRNGVNLFGEDTTLQSGKNLTEVLSEILGKPIKEDNVHSKIICKKCHKFVSEYDSIKVRMQVIKLDLLSHFKTTLPRHQLSYDAYNAEPSAVLVTSLSTTAPSSIPSSSGVEKKTTPKKLVVPASKLQPVPPDFPKWFAAAKNAAYLKPTVTLPNSMSTLNLKVTVGSSVLTQSIKTTTSLGNKMITLSSSNPTQNYVLAPKAEPVDITIDPNILLQTSIDTTDSMPTLSYTMSNISSALTKTSNSVLSFNVKAPALLNKVDVSEFGGIEVNMKKLTNEGSDENNDEQPMEIDEDCSLAVAVGSSQEKTDEQSELDKSKDFLESLLPGLAEDGDGDSPSLHGKYIVGKFEILNGRDEEQDGTTIVMDDENGSIIRLVSGQKYLYGDSEISIVMPEDSDQGDAGDNGDNQDSNDESQIELQVSGDEETANAIIAAAQEQGGAFIKIESGEMYRVQSVQSKTAGDSIVELEPSIGSMVSQLENGQFKCLLCENNDKKVESFTGDALSTTQHLKREHSARAHICPRCGLVVRRRAQYVAHLETHNSGSNLQLFTDKPKVHKCIVCNKKYSSRTLLTEHLHLHTGDKPYTCDVCHKSYASKYTLQSHLKIHLERPRPYNCAQCAKSFFTQQNLNQHEKTHSGIKDFICSICGKAFASQHNLEVHGVVHSGNKPFVCGDCGKAFARRAEVRDHMRIHTGERPFSCDICGASFTQRSNLHSHKRATHLDDKRYHCTQCPKRFKRRRLLDYHVQASHTGERPLKCDLCRATFVYPEHFKKHARIHSGEKPYVCEVCGKSFNSRDNRNTHRFVHSDRKPYECLVCGAGYMRKRLLYHHMNTSGHLAESIVVNQPRVLQTTKNGVQSVVVETVDEKNQFGEEGIYENAEELQLQIETDKDSKSINIVQASEEPALLTLQNEDSFKTDGTILEGITAEQLEQAQIMTNDVSGGSLRLVQIQLPDGNNGWLAINQ